MKNLFFHYIAVEVPCDNYEAEAATKATEEYDGPFYCGCGYKGESDIHSGPIGINVVNAVKLAKSIEDAIQ